MKQAVIQYLKVLLALFLASSRIIRAEFSITVNVVLKAEEEIFVIYSFFVFVLDKDIVGRGVEGIVVDSTWFLELEGLVRRSMVNIFDNSFSSTLNIPVDELLLVDIKDVLLVGR